MLRRLLLLALLFIVTAAPTGGGGGGGGSGTVTSVSGVNGIGVTNPTTTPAISLPACSAAQLLLENAGATSFACGSMSQDCTITAAGVITCTKTNNVAFAPSATTDTTNASNISSGTLGIGQGGTGITGIGALGIQYAGTLANNASLSINWNSGNQVVFQCQGSNTINAPTNPVTGMFYSITEIYNSTNACNATNLTWPTTFKNLQNVTFSTSNDAPSTNTGPASTWWFVYDGANYRYLIPSAIDAWQSWFRSFGAGGSIASPTTTISNAGNIADAAGTASALALTGGGVLSMTGGTAPTLTAGCNGAGSSVNSNSTDNRGQFTTQTAAATTCTMTFNHTWPQAPFCVFTDGGATITPVAFAGGAFTTTTAIVDFASGSNKVVNYHCE